MDFLPDGLAFGIALLFGGTGSVLATMPERYKPIEWAVTYVFLLSLGSPVAGLDLRVSWSAFAETCLATSILLFVTALVRWGQKELAEGEYD